MDIKIIPAHSIEAQDMASGLFEDWLESQFTLSVDLEDETLNENDILIAIQERVAVTFGWKTWESMLVEIKKPHTPVYIDDNNKYLEVGALRFSQDMGVDYAHGTVFEILQRSGVGYSPKFRRNLKLSSTPWGIITEKTQIAEGIEKVSTNIHGGIILSDTRKDEMPKHLSNNSNYYEEDCEARLVELAYPDFFQDSLAGALGSIGVYSARSVPRVISAEIVSLLSGSSDLFSNIAGIRSSNSDEELSRPLNEDEIEVVNYLSQCVLKNRKPINTPVSDNPALQEWVQILKLGLRVDGVLVMKSAQWKEHFHEKLDFDNNGFMGTDS